MKPGDIILVHSGYSILAKTITAFMKEYLRENGIDPKTLPYIPHHAGTIVDMWGELHVAESVGKGYVVRPLLVAYSETEWENRVKLFTPAVPYSKEEQEKISKQAVKLSLSGIPYDKWSLVFQVIKIKFKRWMGVKGKKAEKKFYCSEAVATLANYIRPGTFENPAAANPVDIYINKNFVPSSF